MNHEITACRFQFVGTLRVQLIREEFCAPDMILPAPRSWVEKQLTPIVDVLADLQDSCYELWVTPLLIGEWSV